MCDSIYLEVVEQMEQAMRTRAAQLEVRQFQAQLQVLVGGTPVYAWFGFLGSVMTHGTLNGQAQLVHREETYLCLVFGFVESGAAQKIANAGKEAVEQLIQEEA